MSFTVPRMKLISGLFLKTNEHREHKMNKQHKSSQYMSKTKLSRPAIYRFTGCAL